MFGKGERSILSLVQKFGEMCINMYGNNFCWAKLVNQGAPGIQVGFTEGHSVGTYWVYNPKTKKIILVKKLFMVSITWDNEEELETASYVMKIIKIIIM